ncbi:ABC transporter substrate-binding protein [Methylopila sp. Yamaguchi]|uniref:ABC transporter substrate-binding protein n=1 Tax=Methylopila sp. Yamaguchi TaxID=1437817 RepID=UPI000CBECBA4|nr:ABC transporter substrate-binding protein [Methylopila sp. Yamaguchi]GBD49711.1 peptide ABC transporter substrate-binding protein [Methylopila sp. Yamaguchi]
MGRAATGFTICVLGLALGVVALVATGPGRTATPRDTLVVGQMAEPKSLDPAAVTAANDFRILANLFEGLTRFRPGSLEPAPALAARWEISDDGRAYTFHLRPDVRFHDGTPFDAEAVRFNLDRLLDPKHPSADAGPFPLAFFLAPVMAVEVLDPLTVRLRLDEPYAPLLAHLAYPIGYMVSPAAAKAAGKAFGRAPVGTGPFRFERWESGRQVALVRNEAYWGDKPSLARIAFRPIPDANARASEMLAGGIDLMVEVPPDQLGSFRDPARFALHEAPAPHLWFLILNAVEGPLRDVRVRRAVNLAIDKRTIVENVLSNAATVPSGPISPAFGAAHDPALEPYPHDPERARALIREAGAQGATLTLLAAEGGSGMLEPLAMATAIQADLARVGLKVAIETFEWNAYLARVNGGLKGAAMAEMAWSTNDPDTLPYLALRSEAAADKGGFNAGGFSDPELDRLIDAARGETDAEARAGLYRRIDRLTHDAAPWAFVASAKQTAVTARGVEGLTLEPSSLLELKGMAKR